MRGVSGGERKRTSIGYEILVDPSLLLLDEPTSGLDSTSAAKLLVVLRRLARSAARRTVITTIHQPSSRMFHMFDKLLLVAEGHAIYHGGARGCMRHFAALGFSPGIAMNPAEFLLDLATGNLDGISSPASLLLPSAAAASPDSPEFRSHVIKVCACLVSRAQESLSWRCGCSTCRRGTGRPARRRRRPQRRGRAAAEVARGGMRRRSS